MLSPCLSSFEVPEWHHLDFLARGEVLICFVIKEEKERGEECYFSCNLSLSQVRGTLFVLLVEQVRVQSITPFLLVEQVRMERDTFSLVS